MNSKKRISELERKSELYDIVMMDYLNHDHEAGDRLYDEISDSNYRFWARESEKRVDALESAHKIISVCLLLFAGFSLFEKCFRQRHR